MTSLRKTSTAPVADQMIQKAAKLVHQAAVEGDRAGDGNHFVTERELQQGVESIARNQTSAKAIQDELSEAAACIFPLAKQIRNTRRREDAWENGMGRPLHAAVAQVQDALFSKISAVTGDRSAAVLGAVLTLPLTVPLAAVDVLYGLGWRLGEAMDGEVQVDDVKAAANAIAHGTPYRGDAVFRENGVSYVSASGLTEEDVGSRATVTAKEISKREDIGVEKAVAIVEVYNLAHAMAAAGGQ